MSECIQLSFAVCRIGIYTTAKRCTLCWIKNCLDGWCQRVVCFRALCCKGPPPPRPEYDLVCIGLSGSGKTSLLSQLCSESPENIVSTTGFSIKAVPFQNAILNVKELGGADNIRKYWSRYYQGSQGVIFVLDSASSEDDLETARNELHSALQHPQLCTLPFLILANHQDKPAARSVQEILLQCLCEICASQSLVPSMESQKLAVRQSEAHADTLMIKKYFELEPLARGKRWILKPCSLDDMEAVKDSFSLLINLLEERDFEPSRM
ncbi:ADP-ribosylation factor-like protein 15 isoform X2 [Motacilla alba alba]|uniref:ADP-ribosylation factor-like protein 15 isoform X2 n=1 Tax=Motacilla alba alba TaxID=1094192 RepID=UPI0018D4DEE3|nr:ADP-ribosylation factor-like protein 15 isoform X2 [Motacilla alba alba]XP_037981655.1 ADP-ribosylation factor-like protein 15 isoform X2 [Motacilla alba alba]XP_037981656.1 ADP-ribosylation factor-like protein 15 isoform X2 [Motacilla alba alba]